MIVVDTSALIAVLQNEPKGPACLAVLQKGSLIMSSATLTEALIVTIARGHDHHLVGLIKDAGIDVRPHTSELAYASGEAYRHWGKGLHPASLNYGDCCAYALAKSLNCPLLFIGNDFSQTDIVSAI